MRPLESLFIIALVLYSLAIWGHKWKKDLQAWMIVVFGVALAADAAGTIFLCVFASHGWAWTLHTITGLAALVIMALHFAWALLARFRGAKFAEWFDRWSPWAWGLWLIAFVSGIPR